MNKEQFEKFYKKFEEICSYQHPQLVFRDFCEATAIAISNQVSYSLEREKRYLELVKKHSPETMKEFSHQLSRLVLLFEEEIDDYLGKCYMTLGANARTGQFFTPFHLARLTAAVCAKDLKEPSLIEEPSCGSGCFLLGMAENLLEEGKDPTKLMKVVTRDVDMLCVWMTYIQLSLIGIRAKVILGNSLSDEVVQEWFTPPYAYRGDAF